ncbi:MAG: Ig-like domain repeat protein [Candidatus Omnitrophota bacterium]
MKHSFPVKRSSFKLVALSTTLCFIFSGISVPVSFAAGSEWVLNETQQFVPAMTLEQANAQVPPVLENDIPSGVAVQSSFPLSAASGLSKDSAVPPSIQAPAATMSELAPLFREVSLELRAVSSKTVQALSGHYYPDSYGNPVYYTSYYYRDGAFIQRTGPVYDLSNYRAFMEVSLVEWSAAGADIEKIRKVELVFDAVSTTTGAYNFSIYDMQANEDGLYPTLSGGAAKHYTGVSTLAASMTQKSFARNVSQTISADVTQAVLSDLRSGKTWTGFSAAPDGAIPKIQLANARLKITYDELIPPVTGTITINSGAVYTTSQIVLLNLSATASGSEIGSMSFSTNGTTWSAPVAYATSKTYSLPSGDGSKTVYVKYYDKAGNESEPFSSSIMLDTLPPVGTVKVNGGASYINQTATTLTLSATDAGSGLSQMSFSTNGTTWTTAENYAATKAWTFAIGDGAKKVYVKFQDKVGRWSSAASVTVTLDTVKPTGTININSGALYTAVQTVTLNLTGTDSRSGINTMSFSTDGTNWTTPVAYATSKSFTLADGDGTKKVYVKYYDKAGNASAVYSRSILLDTTPPTGAVNINSGALYATSTAVTLNLSGADSGSGISKMSFSTNGTTWSSAVAYATSKTFTLPSGDGNKTVYVKYYDKAGNVSAVYSKSIILDTLPPAGTVKVNGGTTYINQTAVTLDLAATDAGSGLSKMSFSSNGTTWTTAESYAAQKAWTFATGDGAKKVYVKFQDKVGRWSAVTSVTVTLDTVAPTGSLNINSGAVYASSQTVTLNLSGTDSRSGISKMSFSIDGTNWATPVAYATSKTFTLTDGDGAKQVFVKYYDKAGNASAVYSKSIILDTLPPTGTIKINGGAQYITQSAATMDLSATDAGSGVSQMSFSGDGLNWSAAQAYATSMPVIFSASDGLKKMYVKFQDRSGKWSESASVTVLLDTVKPVGTLSINDGASTSTSSEVTFSLTGSDAGSGVDQVRFSTDQGTIWSEWTAFSETQSFTLPEGNGARQVHCQLMDKAGLISEVFTDSILVDIPPAAPWVPATSNANFAFRVIQDGDISRLELKYIPSGGITLLYSGAGDVPDTFDVTPDGSKVIYEGGGTARVERIGEPWTAQTVAGDLTQILYYSNYVMLKTDWTYPSGTVIRTSTGIRISTFNPEFISSFYLTLVTPGTGFYRNDVLSLAVQPEYDQTSGQYYAHIYSLYGGNDYSSAVRTVSLGNETPGAAGGTFTLVDAVVAPGGQTVLALGLDSLTFNKTFLVNQNITFDGAATSVTYQNNIATYTVREDDGSIRTVRFDLNTLEILPELPAIRFVEPVITQVPSAANQWSLKIDQAMRGVRYEVQFDDGSGVWQTAGTFVAAHYGEVAWQDPAQDRGAVVYRAIPREITTAADLLTQINMLYLETDFGLVESTHEYPLEGWLQRRITQPSNFGFYANLLATIAAGDLVTSTISKAEAIRRLDVMMTHLLEDQQRLGYQGLLPWLGYYNGDWERMDDLYGRQVSFEDNTNMTAGLAVAYGALLDASLSGNATVHASGGILDKIDAFIENQRPGYVAMYNAANQTFARTMVISDGHLEGTVDLFGAESMGPLLFLILQYGDAFPASVYNKLYFSVSDYAMQDGSTRTVVEPFSGAFQMYWPALLLPEADDPDLRAMLETYTDVQLDYAQRNNQPGLLSASYDVGSYDLLSGSVSAFSWQGDVVNPSYGADGSFHLTAGSTNGIGVAFTDNSKYVLEGSALQIRYSSQTAVPNARLEFKQKIDGVLTTVYVQDLTLENTGGEVRTLSLQLPESGVLGDLSEVVFVTSEGSGPLDLTFYSIDTDRIQYNFSLGINEIAMNGVSETTPSTYNLGAAYMFRPEGVEALLQRLINEHPELITSHGLWEGINMSSGKVVKEQVFNNVVSFTLGMAGTGGASMTRYLENKGLTSKLESIWDPQTPVSLTSGTSGNFEWNGFKGTAWHLPEAVRASDRELRITYQSSTPVTGVKLELKHAGSNDPAYSVQFDLPATESGPGEYVITIPESYLYWYITDAVVLFPDAQGYPNDKITSMTLVPAARFVPPAGVEVGVEYTGGDLEALLLQYAPQVNVADLQLLSMPVAPVYHLIYTRGGNLAIGFHAYYKMTGSGPINEWFTEMNYLRPGREVVRLYEGNILSGMSLNGSDEVELWYAYGDMMGVISTGGEMRQIPKNDFTPPVVVLDAGIPGLIKAKTLTVSYTVDGVSKTKLFTDLPEGSNTLSITEKDLAGNSTTVTHQVTVDTVAPVVVLDPGTPAMIASSSITVNYTLDGSLKQKTFTDLVTGANTLTIEESDLAGNRTVVNFSVNHVLGTDLLKGPIATFALNGGNAAASWDSGALHLTSSNFQGMGVAAITNDLSINVRQLQISYSSLTPVPNARIEYKARDSFGNLIIVKTQYLNLQNTGGAVKTVNTDLILSGYPLVDEIVFVTEGTGSSSLDMKLYGFSLF